jgi:hypothetical protein
MRRLVVLGAGTAGTMVVNRLRHLVAGEQAAPRSSSSEQEEAVMARGVVVFESMFGNTEQIANAVAAGLAERMTVDVVRAAPDVIVQDDVELLVLGAPTHAFGLSRPSTRSSAVEQGAPPATGGCPGLREWVDNLNPHGHGPAVAAFDTRIRKRGVPGSAARAAEKRLRRMGLTVLAPATSFWVTGTTGPLLPDEQERARAWGRALADTLLERKDIAPEGQGR